MKQLFTVILSVLAITNGSAQDTEDTNSLGVKVGDVLEIGLPDAPEYKHIDFPRPNFIIKKGGIANYKRVEGNKVVVASVKKKKTVGCRLKSKEPMGGNFLIVTPWSRQI